MVDTEKMPDLLAMTESNDPFKSGEPWRTMRDCALFLIGKLPHPYYSGFPHTPAAFMALHPRLHTIRSLASKIGGKRWPHDRWIYGNHGWRLRLRRLHYPSEDLPKPGDD